VHLEGREKRVLRLRSSSAAYDGDEKPWKAALTVGIVLLPPFAIGLPIGPLYDFFNKTLAVGVVEILSRSGSFAFKRSVIEGQSLAEAEADKVIGIIRAVVEPKTS